MARTRFGDGRDLASEGEGWGGYNDWVALVLSPFLFCLIKLQTSNRVILLGIDIAGSPVTSLPFPSKLKGARAIWNLTATKDPCYTQVVSSSCHFQQMPKDQCWNIMKACRGLSIPLTMGPCNFGLRRGMGLRSKRSEFIWKRPFVRPQLQNPVSEQRS